MKYINNEFNIKTQEFTSDILKKNLSSKEKPISFENNMKLLDGINVDLFLENNFKMPDNVDLVWNKINDIDLKTLQSKDFFDNLQEK
jgi:hypothetical protein